MLELGLEIIPKLKTYAFLKVPFDELDYLEEEVYIINDNKQKIFNVTGYDDRFLTQRANNILNAINVAREKQGYVTFT